MLKVPETWGAVPHSLISYAYGEPGPVRQGDGCTRKSVRDFFPKDFPATQYKRDEGADPVPTPCGPEQQDPYRAFSSHPKPLSTFTTKSIVARLSLSTPTKHTWAQRTPHTLAAPASCSSSEPSWNAPPIPPSAPSLSTSMRRRNISTAQSTTFLTEARKHKAGLILAHQYLGQMTTGASCIGCLQYGHQVCRWRIGQ